MTSVKDGTSRITEAMKYSSLDSLSTITIDSVLMPRLQLKKVGYKNYEKVLYMYFIVLYAVYNKASDFGLNLCHLLVRLKVYHMILPNLNVSHFVKYHSSLSPCTWQNSVKQLSQKFSALSLRPSLSCFMK